jgi:hypothetical protein
LTRKQAAIDAGISKDQAVTAVRVANIPEYEFDKLVESENPPTVTALAGPKEGPGAKSSASVNLPEALKGEAGRDSPRSDRQRPISEQKKPIN